MQNIKEEAIFERLLEAGIEPIEFESENGELTISVHPNDINNAKDIIEQIDANVEYELDEVGMFAKNKVELNAEDMEVFDKLYHMLDEIDDVTAIYHNVIGRD